MENLERELEVGVQNMSIEGDSSTHPEHITAEYVMQLTNPTD